jgi:hypothetical protein
MDPGPSSASADPSPPEEEEAEEEGGGSSGSAWVVVPGSEVLGADAPKVVGWEELQQELARLWSLSAALAAARDRKAGLAARLESALEVVDCFLIRSIRSLLYRYWNRRILLRARAFRALRLAHRRIFGVL